jgi:hypothetical protein
MQRKAKILGAHARTPIGRTMNRASTSRVAEHRWFPRQ